WMLAGVAILCGALTVWLLTRGGSRKIEGASRPAVHQFWSHVFSANRSTDIVLDDGAVGLYQELTGKPISLSEYLDRSYLRGMSAASPDSNTDDKLEQQSTLVLRRQS